MGQPSPSPLLRADTEQPAGDDVQRTRRGAVGTATGSWGVRLARTPEAGLGASFPQSSCAAAARASSVRVTALLLPHVPSGNHWRRIYEQPLVRNANRIP